MGLRIRATFDAYDHLIGIGRILFEVFFQQRQTVVVERAVELSTVPEIACAEGCELGRQENEGRHKEIAPTSVFEGASHSSKGLLPRWRSCPPCQAHEAETNGPDFFIKDLWHSHD